MAKRYGSGESEIGSNDEVRDLARKYLKGIISDAQEKLARIDGTPSNFKAATNGALATGTAKKRTMSPAARKRIAQAVRDRWARKRAEAAAPAPAATAKRGPGRPRKAAKAPKRRASDTATEAAAE